MEIKFISKIPNDWKIMDQGGFSKLLKAIPIKRAHYSIEEFLNDTIYFLVRDRHF